MHIDNQIVNPRSDEAANLIHPREAHGRKLAVNQWLRQGGSIPSSRTLGGEALVVMLSALNQANGVQLPAPLPSPGCGLTVSHLLWEQGIMGVRFPSSRPKPTMKVVVVSPKRYQRLSLQGGRWRLVLLISLVCFR